MPKEWELTEITRIFRGVTYNITISKTNGISKGKLTLIVDGKAIDGNVIPFEKTDKVVEVKVEIR